MTQAINTLTELTKRQEQFAQEAAHTKKLIAGIAALLTPYE